MFWGLVRAYAGAGNAVHEQADSSLPVGAENPVTSCDLQILVKKAAEPVSS